MSRHRSGHPVLLLLCAVAIVASGALPNASSAQESGVYIAAGDSVAAGVGSSLPRVRGYPALLDAWLGAGGNTVVLEHLAIPGETAASFRSDGQLARVLSVLQTASEAGIPVLAISLTLGGNELLSLQPLGLTDRQEGLDQFRGDYVAALSEIRAAAGPDVPIVVTTYYDPFERGGELMFSDAWWLRQFNVAIRESAASVGAAVAELEPEFADRIPEYTHYPFDVHPTNAGHEAIARVVLTALGVAGVAPRIAVVSSVTVTRPTPTLRFQVDGAHEIASVQATSDGAVISGPFDAGDGQHVALVDLGGSDSGAANVTIVVTDVIGQETSMVVTITYSGDLGG
ncbi:MAG TPA: SGNH/GDSL hydrolase family protein [Thermomicrobiales bacterium]|nr:SGNH/GDSL hydrolase family protein [Thermomicrobiales bacterium]